MTKLPSSHDRDPRSTYGDIRRLTTVGLLGLAALAPVIPGFTASATAPKDGIMESSPINAGQNSANQAPATSERSHVERSRMVLLRRAKGAEPFVAWDVICNVNRIDLGDEDGDIVVSDEMDASSVGHCFASETGGKNGLFRTKSTSPKDYATKNKFFEYGLGLAPKLRGEKTSPIAKVTNIVIAPIDKRTRVGHDTAYIHAIKTNGVKPNVFESVEAVTVPSKVELAKRNKKIGEEVFLTAFNVRSRKVVGAKGHMLGTVTANWDIKGTPGIHTDDIKQRINVVTLNGNPEPNNDPAWYGGSGNSPYGLGGLSGRANENDAKFVDLSNPATETPSDAEDRKKIARTRNYLGRLLGRSLKPYPSVVYFQAPESKEFFLNLKAHRDDAAE